LLKVVKYINNAENADSRPSVFVSATAIGYYGKKDIHIYMNLWILLFIPTKKIHPPLTSKKKTSSTGTSEVHSFDESSPSGNDYLSEVHSFTL
jgi:hypothetical protein